MPTNALINSTSSIESDGENHWAIVYFSNSQTWTSSVSLSLHTGTYEIFNKYFLEISHFIKVSSGASFL